MKREKIESWRRKKGKKERNGGEGCYKVIGWWKVINRNINIYDRVKAFVGGSYGMAPKIIFQS